MKIEYMPIPDRVRPINDVLRSAATVRLDNDSSYARESNDRRVAIWGQAKLALPGDVVIHGYAMDISSRSVRISSRQALALNQTCALYLSVRCRGKTLKMTVGVKISSCICCSDSFQLGLQFTAVDPEAAEMIVQLTGK